MRHGSCVFTFKSSMTQKRNWTMRQLLISPFAARSSLTGRTRQKAELNPKLTPVANRVEFAFKCVWPPQSRPCFSGRVGSNYVQLQVSVSPHSCKSVISNEEIIHFSGKQDILRRLRAGVRKSNHPFGIIRFCNSTWLTLESPEFYERSFWLPRPVTPFHSFFFSNMKINVPSSIKKWIY